MYGFFEIPLILFLTIIAPIWIIAHYVTRWRSMKTLSTEDEKILAELWDSVPKMESRINNLEQSGVLKIAGLVDPAQHQEMTTALIGLNIISHGKVDEILEKLPRIDNVTWVTVVTGRYDVIAEVVFKGGMEELYRLTSVEIPKIGNVTSETFVIIKSRGKWIHLPEGMEVL